MAPMIETTEVGLLLKALGWIGSKSIPIVSRALGRTGERISERRRQKRDVRAKEQHQHRVEQEAQRADGPVLVDLRGWCPQIGTDNNGVKYFYWNGDLVPYTRALTEGRYPRDRSFLGSPPTVVR